MDYYRELGLSRTASTGEIRQAYRHCARLNHPDLQSDDASRLEAEIRMKRLNMISGVLTDPLRRREYDRTLPQPTDLVRISRPPLPETAPNVVLDWLRYTNRTTLVWAAAALVGIIGIGAFLAFDEPYRPVPSPVVSIPPRPLPPPPVRQLKTPEAYAPSRRSPPPLPFALPAHPPPASAGVDVPPEPALAVRAQEALPPMPAFGVDQPDVKPAAPGFAGQWLYSPPASPSMAKDLFAPEYIEMKIAQQNGQVWGVYRACYLVNDPTIPPTVVFHFEGRAAAPLATLPWAGSGGAHGKVTLKLVDPDTLEVTWTATRLSRELGLITGVASMTRYLGP